MHAPILATKLQIPQANYNLTPRPRLAERIDHGLDGKLTLVCAPPGYGKTTLLHDWANRCEHRIGWLSLDSGDNVPEILMGYLFATLDSIDDTLGISVHSKLPTSVASMETTSIVLLNEFESLRSKIILVLDEYHVIENATIHAHIAYLLEHLPSQVHLIISSRVIPSLPLARLRVRGEINELHTDDLRFNLIETQDYFRRSGAKELTPADIATLHSCVEGWIDGLQLARQALPDPNIARCPAGLANALARSPSVADYFGEEVLYEAPVHIQEFLLQTSILDDLNSSLCEAVVGDELAHLYLKETVRQNMFVLASKSKPGWFRYHRLFASFLKQRLQDVHPERIHILHQRASRWYEVHDHFGAAIQHALSGQDWERACQLMAKNAESMALQSRLITANRWVTDPAAQHGTSSAAISGAPVTDIVEDLPDLAGRASRSFDIASLLALARVYIALGELNKAEKLLSGIDLIHPDSWGEQLQVALIGALAETFLGQGKLHLAAATYQPFLKLAITRLAEPTSLGFCWGVARIYYEWNQLEDAAAVLQQCVTAGDRQKTASPELLQCCLLSAAVNFALGCHDGIVVAMKQASKLAECASNRDYAEQLEAQQVRISLMQDSFEPAARWLKTYGSEFEEVVPHSRQYEYLTSAWALIAHWRADQALPLLDRLYQAAESTGRSADMMEIGILKALAFQSQGDQRRAFAEVAHALCLAEPERYVRTFVDKGAPIVNLLQLAHARGVTLLYVRELLTALPVDVFAGKKSQALGRPSSMTAQLVEPLTVRELEVLKLVASGRTNHDIADMLTIAPSTVKKHVGNILGKLGAKNRTEAAAQAQVLHLI